MSDFMLYILTIGICYLLYRIFKHLSLTRKLNRWNHTPKDLVILHGLPRAVGVPSHSPFVLKVETYLRMINIPYKYDTTDSFGPTGKTPWISINGEHISDSEVIIQYLSKKFGKDLGNFTKYELAIGTATRVMIEEHLFWGFVRALFVAETRHEATKNMIMPFPRSLILFLIRITYIGYLWAQGLGRLSPEQIRALMLKEYKAVSAILGNKKYLLGDEPCEADAAAFGFLAQHVWGLVSSLKDYSSVLEECPNLADYCDRMKEKFWPDWEQCLAR